MVSLGKNSVRNGFRRLSCPLQLNRNKQARGMPFSENGFKRDADKLVLEVFGHQ